MYQSAHAAKIAPHLAAQNSLAALQILSCLYNKVRTFSGSYLTAWMGLLPIFPASTQQNTPVQKHWGVLLCTHSSKPIGNDT